MKMIVLITLAVYSLSSIAGGSTYEQFKVQKDCYQVRNIIRSCYYEMVNKLSVDLFGVPTTSIKKFHAGDDGNWVVGKIVDEERKAKIYMDLRPLDSRGDHRDLAGLLIEVNSLKYFKGNPFISRKMTRLTMNSFPQASCREDTNTTSRDGLGNPVTYSTEFFLRIWNPKVTIGRLTNEFTVLEDLTYDAEGVVNCIKQGVLK